ncbi:glycoside hydrolase family 18 protein [Mycena alexandri]|uniref:chitinase n=1 Tax=Mycena alexandri TaxID=1745969 RepID=A0AAD6STS9_9AGAR|nr:glycoside hydrolase family 18 protein [Mycena alexandri]
MFSSAGVLSILALSALSVAYDPTRSDNLVVYWGQNSYGQTHPSDPANWQQTISTYCQDSVINAIPIGFIDVFNGIGGLPDLNLANICSSANDPVFPGTGLANCQFLTAGIQGCQAAGKIITLSLGGASGAAFFTSTAQATAFADTIWNTFLGGSSTTRPFGAAVLDGVDLDIEGGGPTGYAAFVTQLRSHMAGASKTYYISAAPQCPFPDAELGSVINAVGFDAIYVQFYNNFCSVASYPNGGWNFADWDAWAKSTSPNKNVKIFIGAPASPTAGANYVDAATLGAIVVATRAQFSSLGGVMLWDASQAYANGRFDISVKNLIAGGTSTTKTTTTSSATTSKTTTTTSKTTTTTSKATTSTTTISTTTSTVTSGSCAGVAAWVSTTAYPGGSLVTFAGHLWEANWWSEADSPTGPSGDWADHGACTSLAATVKAQGTAAIAATLTGAAHATPAATANGKAADATVETGKVKLQGRENSRVFRF